MKRRKFFFLFTGEDWQILRSADIKVQEHFILNGFRVFLLIIVVFSSFSFFIHECDLQIHPILEFFVDVTLSLFLTFVFINLYILTLFTLSPNILPERDEQYLKRFGKWFDKHGGNLSVIIRLMFIAFIGFCISKPFELEIYDLLEPVNGRGVLTRLGDLHTGYPLFWFFTAGFLYLYLYPIYDKYKSSELLHPYYISKREIQHNMINESFQHFQKEYKTTFKLKWQETVKIESIYSNPPFNTRRKKLEATLNDTEDFLNDLKANLS